MRSFRKIIANVMGSESGLKKVTTADVYPLHAKYRDRKSSV